MIAKEALKPCPFCGCDIEIIPGIGDYPERIMVTDMHHNSCVFSGDDSLSYIAHYEGPAALHLNGTQEQHEPRR